MKSILSLVLLSVCLACGEPGSIAIPKLQKALSSKDSRERNQAAQTLASYGAEAAPATAALILLLKDSNMGVRSSAAYALRGIGSETAKRALDRYQKEKGDSEEEARQE